MYVWCDANQQQHGCSGIGFCTQQAATLERRVGELEEELGNLAAAAQAAEDQSVQLMQQVRTRCHRSIRRGQYGTSCCAAGWQVLHRFSSAIHECTVRAGVPFCVLQVQAARAAEADAARESAALAEQVCKKCA